MSHMPSHVTRQNELVTPKTAQGHLRQPFLSTAYLQSCKQDDWLTCQNVPPPLTRPLTLPPQALM